MPLNIMLLLFIGFDHVDIKNNVFILILLVKYNNNFTSTFFNVNKVFCIMIQPPPQNIHTQYNFAYIQMYMHKIYMEVSKQYILFTCAVGPDIFYFVKFHCSTLFIKTMK